MKYWFWAPASFAMTADDAPNPNLVRPGAKELTEDEYKKTLADLRVQMSDPDLPRTVELTGKQKHTTSLKARKLVVTVEIDETTGPVPMKNLPTVDGDPLKSGTYKYDTYGEAITIETFGPKTSVILRERP